MPETESVGGAAAADEAGDSEPESKRPIGDSQQQEEEYLQRPYNTWR